MIKNMVGVDIVLNERFKSFVNDERKYKRILSEKELEIFLSFKSEKRKIEYIASRFAGKEAIYKAINNNESFTSISILNDVDGRPYVVQKFTDLKINISLSHEERYSIAFVIVE